MPSEVPLSEILSAAIVAAFIATALWVAFVMLVITILDKYAIWRARTEVKRKKVR